MNVKNFLEGTRILYGIIDYKTEVSNKWPNSVFEPIEGYIIEFSPLKEYCRIGGRWHRCDKIRVLEVLHAPEKGEK